MSSEEMSLKQAMARDLAEKIPVGHHNAISRDALAARSGLCDRHVRELLETARDLGVLICNDQDGKGYYIAETPEEIERQYKRDKARALSVLKRLKASRAALKEAGRTV